MTHGPDQAVLGLGRPATNVSPNQPGVLDENEDNDLAALGVDNAELTAARAADLATAAADVDADIVTHGALDTGVHGAGASTLATADDIATHAGLDLAAAVHGFKGIRKAVKDGTTEVAAVNEVKILTPSGGAENDTFTLAVGGLDSGTVTIPAGGFAAITAAQVEAALESGALAYAAGDIAVTGGNGGPFTLTYGGTLAGTAVGNMTVTNATGAAAATVTDDGTGASVQGVVQTRVFTVTGVAVGDILNEVVVYATKASIATQVVRATGDFTISGTNEITVAANFTDNTNNQYLFEWVDLT